jgi:Family of unknown function (DUF5681)
MRRRPPVTSADDDYQVGYRRPPVEHRFKPGQSGNLKGRPRSHKISHRSWNEPWTHGSPSRKTVDAASSRCGKLSFVAL